MKARFLIPLGVFLGLVVLLGVGLTLDPRDVPSVLIDKKASEFSLPDLFDSGKRVDSATMKGQVWLVNVWGTWCPECWREHDFLLYLAKQEKVPIIGIDWRDEDAEAINFLREKGNPFLAVGIDPESKAVMDLGVYGAPETFLIDKQGVIRKKHKGAMTPQVWREEFKPLIEKLEKS
ncbi:MAG: DsbE family thiol:disulfide interchange protein [Gammaproteobacteria bacterium]|nr:DsbE family thiol:disulfide interchange protein [Gammaproteobacteria bacterium]MCP5416109.1 DsbE family thiol:disulfide interchange protein [Chromatiaceae bacterium]